MDKECPVCGNAFKAKYEWNKFCSRTCAYKGRNNNSYRDNLTSVKSVPHDDGIPESFQYEKNCTECGKSISKKVSLYSGTLSEFCSPACRNSHYGKIGASKRWSMVDPTKQTDK